MKLNEIIIMKLKERTMMRLKELLPDLLVGVAVFLILISALILIYKYCNIAVFWVAVALLLLPRITGK